jgi:hypothetical protein
MLIHVAHAGMNTWMRSGEPGLEAVAVAGVRVLPLEHLGQLGLLLVVPRVDRLLLALQADAAGGLRVQRVVGAVQRVAAHVRVPRGVADYELVDLALLQQAVLPLGEEPPCRAAAWARLVLQPGGLLGLALGTALRDRQGNSPAPARLLLQVLVEALDEACEPRLFDLLWLYKGPIEILAAQVSDRHIPLLERLFEQQIIGSSDMVVAVGLDTLPRKVTVKRMVHKKIEYLLIDRDKVIADIDPHRRGRRSQPNPAMPPDLLDSHPAVRVRSENALKEVDGLRGDEPGDRIVPGEYLFVEGGGVGILKGQAAADHGEEDDPAGPDVDPQACVFLAGDHFGGRVAGRPAGGLEQLDLVGAAEPLVGVRQPEVHDLYAPVEVDQQVLGLEVAVHHFQRVDVLDPVQDLLEDAAGLGLGQAFLLDDVVEQLALGDVLHHEEQLLLGLDDFVELDDVGVPDELEDVHFPRDALDVCDVHDLALLEDLDGHGLLGEGVVGQLDLAEGALAEGLAEDVLADGLGTLRFALLLHYNQSPFISGCRLSATLLE